MNKNLKSCLLVLVVLFSTTGCATIFGGGSMENLSVESSSPIKVKVIASDGETFTRTTPFTYDMSRKKTYTIKLVSDQYESSDIHLDKSVRGLAFINLLCLLCWGIDFATGNVWAHERKYVYIDTKDLERKKASLNSNLEKIEALITILIEGKDDRFEPGKAQVSNKIEFHRIAS
jgi:hypothetical protein